MVRLPGEATWPLVGMVIIRSITQQSLTMSYAQTRCEAVAAWTSAATMASQLAVHMTSPPVEQSTATAMAAAAAVAVETVQINMAAAVDIGQISEAAAAATAWEMMVMTAKQTAVGAAAASSAAAIVATAENGGDDRTQRAINGRRKGGRVRLRCDASLRLSLSLPAARIYAPAPAPDVNVLPSGRRPPIP